VTQNFVHDAKVAMRGRVENAVNDFFRKGPTPKFSLVSEYLSLGSHYETETIRIGMSWNPTQLDET